MISWDTAGTVGEGETGTFSCHSGGEGGGEIGALPNGLDSGIPQRLTANTAEYSVWRSENIFKAAVSLRSIQESSGAESHVLAKSMTG